MYKYINIYKYIYISVYLKEHNEVAFSKHKYSNCISTAFIYVALLCICVAFINIIEFRCKTTFYLKGRNQISMT